MVRVETKQAVATEVCLSSDSIFFWEGTHHACLLEVLVVLVERVLQLALEARVGHERLDADRCGGALRAHGLRPAHDGLVDALGDVVDRLHGSSVLGV